MKGFILRADLYDHVKSFVKMVFLPSWENVSSFESLAVIPFFDNMNGFCVDRKFIRLMALIGFFMVWFMCALVFDLIFSSMHETIANILKGYFTLVAFCYIVQTPQKLQER